MSKSAIPFPAHVPRTRPGAAVGRIVALAVVCVATAACGLIEMPEAELEAARVVPGRFRHAAEPAAPSPQDERSAAKSPWARFGARDLAELVERADLGNLDLAAAAARVGQYEAIAAQAEAGRLPSLGLEGSRSHSRPSASTLGVPASAVSETRLFGLGVVAAYEVDLWGKAGATARAAGHGAEAGRHDLAAVRLSVETRVANGCLRIRSLHDRRRTAERSIRLASDVEAIMRQRVTAGTATEIDLTQQQAVVLQLKATVPGLDRAIEQETIALALLVGVVPGDVRLSGAGLAGLVLPRQSPGLPVELLRHRPDIRRAEEAVLAAAENVGAARAALLPNVTLSLQAGYQSPLLSTMVSPASGLYQIVGGVSQPLLDAVRLTAALRQQEARRDELVAAYRAAILAGLGDVESALVALRYARAELGIRRAVVERAERAYRLANEQLSAGQIDILTSMSTQKAYFDALDALDQTRLTEFQAAVSLVAALGGQWLAEPRDGATPAPPPPQTSPL